MPEHYVDHFDKLLVKSMDFCEFLTILPEDLKIEEVQKDTKVIFSKDSFPTTLSGVLD